MLVSEVAIKCSSLIRYVRLDRDYCLNGEGDEDVLAVVILINLSFIKTSLCESDGCDDTMRFAGHGRQELEGLV